VARGDRIYVHKIVKYVWKETEIMTRIVEAIYEKNVLKPIEPIEGIEEHERVTVILCSHPNKKSLRELAGTLTHEEAEV
jgi:predicted DNA-binding antitoxin AbrB/MazE fold protein